MKDGWNDGQEFIPPEQWGAFIRCLTKSVKRQIYLQDVEDKPPRDKTETEQYLHEVEKLVSATDKYVSESLEDGAEKSIGKRRVARFDPGFEYLLIETIVLLGEHGDGIIDRASFHAILNHYDPSRSVAAIWTKLDGWRKMTPPLVHWPANNRQDISVEKFGLGYLATIKKDAKSRKEKIEQALQANGFKDYAFKD